MDPNNIQVRLSRSPVVHCVADYLLTNLGDTHTSSCAQVISRIPYNKVRRNGDRIALEFESEIAGMRDYPGKRPKREEIIRGAQIAVTHFQHNSPTFKHYHRLDPMTMIG